MVGAIAQPMILREYKSITTVTLAAEAAAASGRMVSKVEFYQGTTLLATSTSAPYQATSSNVAVGNYTLTAKMTDNQGSSQTSAPIRITVTQGTSVTIIGHGNYKGHVIGSDGKIMTPEDFSKLADIIRKNKDFKKGMPINMRVCGAGYGDKSAGQKISDLFPGSTVKALPETVTPEGMTPSWWSVNPLNPSGNWRTFQSK